MWRPRGHELGEANEVAEWNGGVDGVSAKGGRICWEVVSTCRLQKEWAGGEGSKERFWRAGIVGGRSPGSEYWERDGDLGPEYDEVVK